MQFLLLLIVQSQSPINLKFNELCQLQDPVGKNRLRLDVHVGPVAGDGDSAIATENQ